MAHATLPVMDEKRGHFSPVPREILDEIVSHLPNRDIKNLRRASSFFANNVVLRLSRVFLSSNPRNIQVVQLIADHETLRHQVEELIWDDSLLVPPDDPMAIRIYSEYDRSMPLSDPEPNHNYLDQLCTLHLQQQWALTRFNIPYAQSCMFNVQDIRVRRGNDGDTPAHVEREERLENMMSLPESLNYYEKLVAEQQQVVDDGADASALRNALSRFPNLSKITITPVCHGFLFTPLYETPMIRDFQMGFNYPIPRTWPTSLTAAGRIESIRWKGFTPATKFKWRGVCLVLEALADQNQRHSITELDFNVHGFRMGLSTNFFDPTNVEYHHLVTLIRRPGFRRLNLSIEVPPSETSNSLRQRSHMIHHTLSQASEMEHFSVHCNLDGYEESFEALRKSLPIQKWPRLEHFGLFGFRVNVDDLIDLLSSMPLTLRTLELGFLKFRPEVPGQNFYNLITAMRDVLGWREKPKHQRPKVIIRLELYQMVCGRYITANEEVADFLYGNGPNPFGYLCEGDDDLSFLDSFIEKGIRHNEFDPEYERPNLSLEELADCGLFRFTQELESSEED